MVIGGYVGVFPGGTDEAAFATAWDQFGTSLGVPLKIGVTGIDQTTPVSSWENSNAYAVGCWSSSPTLKDAGVIPLIGLPMASSASGQPTAMEMFTAFCAGSYDALITECVKAWAAAGFMTQYWRPGWEMNDSGQPWYVTNVPATQAQYRYAFRHIYGVLHAAAAAAGVTMQVIWCPMVGTWTGITYTTNFGNIYPACEDIVACDIYSSQWPVGVTDAEYPAWAAVTQNRIDYWNYPAGPTGTTEDNSNHTSMSFRQVMALAKLVAKPFAICETGAGGSYPSHDLEDEPAFPGWLMTTLAGGGVKVAFVSIWDKGTWAFSAGQKPLEQAAWAKALAA